MSDPTPEGTVRGWLETIANSLAPTAILSDILTELRFLNSRLLGGNSVQPPLYNIPTWGLLRDALYWRTTGEFGDTFTSVSTQIRSALRDANSTSLYFYVQDTRDKLIEIRNLLTHSPTSESAAQLLAGMRANIASMAAALGVEVNDNTVNQHLALILSALAGLQAQDGAQYAIQNAATVEIAELLQCICSNTSPPEEPPPPENEPPTVCAILSDVEWRRVDFWQYKGTQTIGGVQRAVYTAIFDVEDTGLMKRNDTQTENICYQVLETNTAVDTCISWDFTGNDEPVGFCRDIGTSDSIANSAVANCGFVNLTSDNVYYRYEWNLDTQPNDYRWVWNFAFDEGVTPSRNVFLRARLVSF